MPVPHTADPFAALEKLTEVFYSERAVELPEGHKIVLSSLGSGQEASANARVQDFRAIHFIKAIKVEQLAYSIVEVDGTRFDKPVAKDGSLDESLYEGQVSAKRMILRSWPEAIVTHIFNELCLLQDEVEARVGVEVKTDLPSEDDAKQAEQESEQPDDQSPNPGTQGEPPTA